MKKKLALLLSAAMLLSAMTGCGSKPSASSSASSSGESSSASSSSGSVSADVSTGDSSVEELVLPNLMVMSGPTGVGAAKLLADHDADPASSPLASHAVVTDNSEVMNALVNGDADIAAVATNVASNLVNKTDGGIQVLAINTLGVLYILEKGDTVQSMADLKGQTLYAPSTAKGANPEYILNYLLTQNGVEPSEVDIQWMTPQEITALMASSEAGICMLPVPAATALLIKDSGVREAISLSDQWDLLDNGALAQGCIVAQTKFVEENPQAVENFLAAYEQSIAYMNDEANREDAAALVAQYGITANAAIAAKAIPQCNLTYITGVEMQNTLESFYQIMYQADPASIGGAMPYDSFYYGVE